MTKQSDQTVTAEKTIRDRIRKVLAHKLELQIESEAFTAIGRLDEIFGMDSIAVIEFVIGLEQEFGITIPPENLDIEILKDVNKLEAYLRGKLNNKNV